MAALTIPLKWSVVYLSVVAIGNVYQVYLLVCLFDYGLLLQCALSGLSSGRVLIGGLSSKVEKKKTARKKETKTPDKEKRGQKNS